MQDQNEIKENGRDAGAVSPLAQDLLKGAAAAAKYVGETRGCIYRLTAAEQIPFIRKGKSLYYRKSDLDAAFQSAA
jgi:hypothetical protein